MKATMLHHIEDVGEWRLFSFKHPLDPRIDASVSVNRFGRSYPNHARVEVIHANADSRGASLVAARRVAELLTAVCAYMATLELPKRGGRLR